MHPSPRSFTIRVSPSLRARIPRLGVRALLRTAKCPEPLCRPQALPATVASPARYQKALPLLHRSYRLMRQTKTLPSPRFVGLCERSLQVVASPCWELALPDVSSTVCVEVLGPIPRRVRPVHLPVSSRTTSASPHEGQVRHAKYPLHYNFSQGSAFRGCSHSLMFRLLNLLDLQVVPTAGMCQGSQAFYTTQDLHRYRTQVVASLRTRLGQLVRRDLHPRDCIVVGCYPPRLRLGLLWDARVTLST
jgi:hypothetical protein